ncbi:MAG: hypothetical protein EP332_06365 [Bacteroidetes bacterium]|nr:MAG: hypothetical protein EP332_06365 [Bacteroidota bacterium]
MNTGSLLNVLVAGAGAIGLYKVADVLGLMKSGDEKKTQKFVDAIHVDEKSLSLPMSAYQSIANGQYTELSSHFLSWNLYDFSKLKNAISGLNAEELKQVYKQFGIRPAKLFTVIDFGEAGDLFEWYSVILNEGEQKEMAAIWNKTGIYPDKSYAYGHLKNPNRAISDKWREIPYNIGAATVYPRYYNYYLLVYTRNNTGGMIPYRTLEIKSPQALGKITMILGSSAANKAVWVKVKITNTSLLNQSRYSFLKENDQVWIRTIYLNTTPPPAGISGDMLFKEPNKVNPQIMY